MRVDGQRLAGRAVAAVFSGMLHILLVLSFDPATSVLYIPAADEPQIKSLRVVTLVSEEAGMPATITAWTMLPTTLPTPISIPQPVLPEFDALLTDSLDEARETSSPADYEKAEHLQMIYRGQIQSRLLRMVEESGIASFGNTRSCVVNVIQNERGHVLDVLADQCPLQGDYVARVVDAIWKASPLPLPPQGLSRGTYLTLDLSPQ